MKQIVFNFAEDTKSEQLELFPIDVYDNRIERMRYAIRISRALHGWSVFNLKDVQECVKLFQVSHQDVYEYGKI